MCKIQFWGGVGREAATQLSGEHSPLTLYFLKAATEEEATGVGWRVQSWELTRTWKLVVNTPPPTYPPPRTSTLLPAASCRDRPTLSPGLTSWGKKRAVFLPSFYPKLVFLFILCGLPPSWWHYLAAHELTHRVKLTVNNKYPLTFLPTGEKLHFNRRPLELCVLIKRWTFPPQWCLRGPFYFFSRRGIVVPIFSKLTIQIKVYLVSIKGQQCW